MRLIFGPDGAAGAGEVSPAQLRGLYRYPGAGQRGADGAWWRVNMVSSLDGAACAGDGLSAGLGSAADQRVFALLRSLAQVVVVGAGTARAEGYGPLAGVALVVVSRSGWFPQPGAAAAADAGPGGELLLATCAAAGADRLARARAVLGPDRVLADSGETVRLGWLRAQLARRGLRRVLLEGGPALLGDALAAGVADELCLTISPVLLGGEASRIVAGAPVRIGLRPVSLLADDGVLLGRWLVGR